MEEKYNNIIYMFVIVNLLSMFSMSFYIQRGGDINNKAPSTYEMVGYLGFVFLKLETFFIFSSWLVILALRKQYMQLRFSTTKAIFESL